VINQSTQWGQVETSTHFTRSFGLTRDGVKARVDLNEPAGCNGSGSFDLTWATIRKEGRGCVLKCHRATPGSIQPTDPCPIYARRERTQSSHAFWIIWSKTGAHAPRSPQKCASEPNFAMGRESPTPTTNPTEGLGTCGIERPNPIRCAHSTASDGFARTALGDCPGDPDHLPDRRSPGKRKLNERTQFHPEIGLETRFSIPMKAHN